MHVFALELPVAFWSLERAMGIEPTRVAPPALENKRFVAKAGAKCDGRVNYSGIWNNVGIRQ